MKALTWLYALSLFPSGGKVFNFDSYRIGQVPPGWTTESPGAAPNWEIRTDRTAPTQPYVLAEIPSGRNNSRTPLAILNNLTTRDADVSVRIKPVSGHDGLAGGLVWRYRNENNYYVARADATENTVTVFKVENGRKIPLLTDVKHPIPANSWSILKVSVRGARFQVFVDHRRVLEGRDSAFSTTGRVGLWAMTDCTVYFDDFRVYPK